MTKKEQVCLFCVGFAFIPVGALISYILPMRLAEKPVAAPVNQTAVVKWTYETKPPKGWKLLSDGKQFAWQDDIGLVSRDMYETKEAAILAAWRFKNYWDNLTATRANLKEVQP